MEYNQNEHTYSENDIVNQDAPKRHQGKRLHNTPRLRKILVPYSVSQVSDKALRYALYISRIFNSETHILAIVEDHEDLKYLLPSTIRVNPQEALEKKIRNDLKQNDLKVSVEGNLKEIIEKKISLCNDIGLDNLITIEIRTGNPSNEIVKVSESDGFDMVVMSSQRITSNMKRIGSVTRKVMDAIRKPVLVVHE